MQTSRPDPLYLVGTGGSIDHHTGKEKTIAITFQIFHPLSKEACRWISVEIAKLFLSNINNSSDLIPFLPEGHFTYQNVNVRIGVLSANRTLLYYPDITFVALEDGEISYATNDPQYIGMVQKQPKLGNSRRSRACPLLG